MVDWHIFQVSLFLLMVFPAFFRTLNPELYKINPILQSLARKDFYRFWLKIFKKWAEKTPENRSSWCNFTQSSTIIHTWLMNHTLHTNNYCIEIYTSRKSHKWDCVLNKLRNLHEFEKMNEIIAKNERCNSWIKKSYRKKYSVLSNNYNNLQIRFVCFLLLLFFIYFISLTMNLLFVQSHKNKLC